MRRDCGWGIRSIWRLFRRRWKNVRKLLIENGYFDPEVNPEFDYDMAYQQVNITFALKTGKRAHYLPPQVSGDTSVVSAKAITSATHWHRFLVPGIAGSR